MIDKNAVLEALRQVNDPELNQDIVSLGMVKNLSVDTFAVTLKVNLTTPTCPLKAELENDVRQAISKVEGVERIDLEMGFEVRKSIKPIDNMIPEVANTIVIGSGKGGVGKSTVSTNLAISFARAGAKVGLLDADVYGPNQPTMLGAKTKPNVDPNNQKILPVEVHNVKLISMGFFVQENEPVIWRGPMLHSAMKQFLGDVDWGVLDYLFIDLPPGTGDVQLSLSQVIPLTGAVMVTTPQDVAVHDMKKAAMMFNKVKIPILGIIENMSYFVCPDCNSKSDIFGTGGGESAAAELRVPFLGAIPLDQRIRVGADEGRPITLSDDENISKVYRRIVEQLAAKISVLAFEKQQLTILNV